MATRAATLPRVTSALDAVRSIATLVAGVALLGSVIGGIGPFAAPSIGAPPAPTAVAAVPTIIPPPTMPGASAAPTLAPTVAPTSAPVASPVASPIPALPANVWFADTFDDVGAWPAGEAEYYTATVAGGRYRIEPGEVDLPVYLWAASEGTPGTSVTIEATLTILGGDIPVAAGIAFGDADDTNRLALTIDATGGYTLASDGLEAYRTLLVGPSGMRSGVPMRLRLAIDPTGTTIAVDGHVLDRADVRVDVARFGISVWASADGALVEIDDVVVTTGV